MPEYGAADLSVVIPTRDRWDILVRTLAALEAQTAAGFETIVVVDGTDQQVPDLHRARTVVKAHGGPGAARNRGVAESSRALILFLGDDMVPAPDLVARHLDRHNRSTGAEAAVLGRVSWHPDLGRNRICEWLDWSGTQFDYRLIETEEAGFGRFFSCNVSLKRAFFVGAGGFDEEFTYYYEDLDCGWRLDQRGMRLLYAPDARVFHLHDYDLERVRRRFAGVARGERLMAAKHPWFTPFFEQRVQGALGRRRASALWPIVVGAVPEGSGRLRRTAERRANDWYYQRLGVDFLAAWEGERDLEELKEYLGRDYQEALLHGHTSVLEEEEELAPNEAAFYRTSAMYLYDLTAFAMTGTKWPYRAEIRRLLPAGSSLLDWGCGIGSDGLRLMEAGYRVAFADFDNPSTRYLRWRLGHRGVAAEVYDIEAERIPGGFDLAYSFDVIEHVKDPFSFLGELESRARLVMVNLLEPEPNDTRLHHDLPIGSILDHAERRGIVRYRRHHGRSHLVAYRADGSSMVGRARSTVERHLGRAMSALGRL